MTALIWCCLSAASRASICCQIGATAPIARNEVDVELELLRDAAPQHGELAGLGHQHLVAGRQHVDDRGLPGAGAGRGEDDHGLLGAEHPLHRGQDREAELGELRTAMVQVGMSIARSTRSGTLVGPGNCRKCLPVCTVIGVLPGLALVLMAAE